MADELVRAYLIRQWRIRPDAPWRYTVKRAHDAIEHHFTSEDEVVRFLVEQAGDDPPPSLKRDVFSL